MRTNAWMLCKEHKNNTAHGGGLRYYVKTVTPGIITLTKKYNYLILIGTMND